MRADRFGVSASVVSAVRPARNGHFCAAGGASWKPAGWQGMVCVVVDISSCLRELLTGYCDRSASRPVQRARHPVPAQNGTTPRCDANPLAAHNRMI